VLGDSGDKVNAAGFSDSTIDKTGFLHLSSLLMLFATPRFCPEMNT
jgi:hypothetical protein